MCRQYFAFVRTAVGNFDYVVAIRGPDQSAVLSDRAFVCGIFQRVKQGHPADESHVAAPRFGTYVIGKFFGKPGEVFAFVQHVHYVFAFCVCSGGVPVDYAQHYMAYADIFFQPGVFFFNEGVFKAVVSEVGRSQLLAISGNLVLVCLHGIVAFFLGFQYLQLEVGEHVHIFFGSRPVFRQVAVFVIIILELLF